MRRTRGSWRALGVSLAVLAAGCGLVTAHPRDEQDFFPLAPSSQWEYAVSRHGETGVLRFVATVRSDPYRTADGRACPIVDEQYGADAVRYPVVYCRESGFLHRLMSLEYKGETLEDNGLRSGELKFLPLDLRAARDWEGTTNAYHLPDGSGFEVRQLHHVLPRLERVDVPAGAFRQCVHVETKAIHSAIDVDGAHTGPQVVLYYSDWYAPGVGLVRTDQRDADAHAMTTIELVHYAAGGRR
ncbi:MAG TPA: hypothetical protein VGK30_02765 [Candidatus Binatia bacterium]